MPDARPARRISSLGSVLAVLIVFMVTGCGGQERSAASPGDSGREIAVSMTARPAQTFTVDDLVAAGWKKKREFGTEGLPHAEAALFGFFNQKDIEIWFYGSHSDALEHGVGPAEQAIARKPGQTDYLIPQVNRYHAYAVVGNMVMLCEFELADCQALIAKLR